MAPRVSVVVPVFNAAKFLAEAIESILASTYSDLEVVVVDDGSTDGSGEIARRYGERVRVLSQVNQGPSAARNAGVAAARGELIAFCDSDDVQLPYRLAAHAFLLDRSPRAALAAGELSLLDDGQVSARMGLRKLWIGPRSRSFDEELLAGFADPPRTCRELGVPVPAELEGARVFSGSIAPLIALMHLAWGNAAMFRRSALDEVGGFDDTIRYYEDWHLVARISKRHDVVFLDAPVMHYRRHPEQMTRRPGAAEGYLRIVNDVWRSDPSFYLQHRRLVDRAAGSAYYQLGALHASRLDWRGAQRCFLESIRAEPRQRRVYLELLKASLQRGSHELLHG